MNTRVGKRLWFKDRGMVSRLDDDVCLAFVGEPVLFTLRSFMY